ncbi:tape measure protein, partial [Arthrospira platensis SPKY1]|nr:tape measure protein [Arthrospira platensis SPKY1]
QGIAEASRAAGLGTQDVEAVFLALGQIASKGTLALEELRGQLGERIPAAVESAAKGLSELSGELITTEELLRRINRGEVSGSAIVALAKALKDEFGASLPIALESPIAALARFRNTIFDIRQELANSGFIDALVDGLKEVNKEIRTPEFKEGFKAFGEGLVAVTRFMVALIKEFDLFVTLIGTIVGIKIGRYLSGL